VCEAWKKPEQVCLSKYAWAHKPTSITMQKHHAYRNNSFITKPTSRSSLSANSMSEQKTNTTKEVSLFDHIKAPFFLGPVKYRNFQCFQKGDRGATSSSVNVSCTYDRMNYMSAIIPYHFHCWSISWAEMKSWPWKQAKCHSVAVRSVPNDTFLFLTD